MEEPENSAAWFILHENVRYGPFTVEQLKEGAMDHELHPRYDMAWQEGMGDWIPVGEVEGLFEKTGGSKKEGEEQDQKKKKKKKKEETEEDSSAPFGENDPDEENNNYDDGEWEGVSRAGFFFFTCIFPILWFVGLIYASGMLPGIFGEEIAPIITACLAFLPLILVIFAVIQRLDNLAMRRLWFFGLLVPLLQYWVVFRLFACPPGYAEHKRLGVIGWILGIIYWLPFVAMIGGIILILVTDIGVDMIKPYLEKNKAQYEQLMDKAKQITETPEEKKAREEEQKAKEKAAKGPSIIPIKR